MTDKTIDMTDDENILELYHRISENKQELNDIITVKDENENILPFDDLDLQLVEKIEWEPKKLGDYNFNIKDNNYNVNINSLISYKNYSTGSKPNDWTERLDSGGSWSIISEDWATKNYALRQNTTSGTLNEERVLSYDKADDIDDFEIVVKTRFDAPESLRYRPIVGRLSGSVGDENGIFVRLIDKNSILLRIRENGDIIDAHEVPMDLSDNIDFWVRLYVIGDELKLKAWLDTEDEPEDWNIETKNDTIMTGDYNGVGFRRIRNDYFWDIFAFWVGESGIDTGVKDFILNSIN